VNKQEKDVFLWFKTRKIYSNYQAGKQRKTNEEKHRISFELKPSFQAKKEFSMHFTQFSSNRNG